MKHALLIGTNYTGQSVQLNGCIDDINNIKNYLISKCGYLTSNIITLLNSDASDNNIMNAVCNLTNGVTNGDTLFFYYSGHGTSIGNLHSCFKNEQDDAIIPNDYTSTGFITDDWLYNNLTSKVPSGVTLWAFTDCCHSGTMLDLKYNWTYNATYNGKSQVTKNLVYNSSEWNNNFNVNIINSNETNGHVFLFSGCQDNQTSADTYENNQYQGAFSFCLLKYLSTLNGNVAIGDILKAVNCLLTINNYSQKSQLSVGKSSDINYTFSI